jgi:hypothetical protein
MLRTRMLRRGTPVKIDLSGEILASIFWATRISEVETKLIFSGNRNTLRRNYLQDEGYTFLRNVGSHKYHTA